MCVLISWTVLAQSRICVHGPSANFIGSSGGRRFSVSGYPKEKRSRKPNRPGWGRWLKLKSRIVPVAYRSKQSLIHQSKIIFGSRSICVNSRNCSRIRFWNNSQHRALRCRAQSEWRAVLFTILRCYGSRKSTSTPAEQPGSRPIRVPGFPQLDQAWRIRNRTNLLPKDRRKRRRQTRSMPRTGS